MHSANHRLDYGINKDREVDVATRKLEHIMFQFSADPPITPPAHRS
jgi:hypothetical protein